jgi:hypothetical protein
MSLTHSKEENVGSYCMDDLFDADIVGGHGGMVGIALCETIHYRLKRLKMGILLADVPLMRQDRLMIMQAWGVDLD